MCKLISFWEISFIINWTALCFGKIKLGRERINKNPKCKHSHIAKIFIIFHFAAGLIPTIPGGYRVVNHSKKITYTIIWKIKKKIKKKSKESVKIQQQNLQNEKHYVRIFFERFTSEQWANISYVRFFLYILFISSMDRVLESLLFSRASFKWLQKRVGELLPTLRETGKRFPRKAFLLSFMSAQSNSNKNTR